MGSVFPNHSLSFPYFLCQAKPIQRLAPNKPPSSAFAVSVMVSVAGQFVVHLASIVALMTICEQHVVAEDANITADGRFQPNIINSSMFILSSVMQVIVAMHYA